MNNEERKASDRKAHEQLVQRAVSRGIPRSEADMAVGVAIEVVRSVELKLQDDIHARLGHIPRVSALSLTTALELLPTMAAGMAEQLLTKLGGGIDLEAMLNALLGGEEGMDMMKDIFKDEMIAKATQMGLTPKGDKTAILIIGCNPTDESCECSACQSIRLINQHPDILPEDRVVVDEENHVQAVRMTQDVARRIHRDAQLLAQKAGEA